MPKFCLIGRGSIGTRHLRNLQALSIEPIIAYSEFPDERKDEDYYSEYRVRTIHDPDEIRLEKPDAFIIASPTAAHLKHARLALEMNGHIFMEKPLSHTCEGVRELQEDLAQKQLIFFLANNFRFHRALNSIKELIGNGRFGRIYFARIMVGQYLPDWHPSEDYRKSYSACRDLGGGVVLTLQHEIDYAYWLFGGFRRILSSVKKISDLEIDVEDVASIIIEADSGALIEIHLDCLQRPPKRTLHIQGSEGSVDYQFGSRCLKFYDFKERRNIEIMDLPDNEGDRMYIEEMRHFIECIRSGARPASTLDDGIYVLNACLNIKKGFQP